MISTTDREITLALTNNDMTVIAETIGSWEKLWGAVGYLSTWNTSYPDVHIYRDGDTDLVAVYRNDEGQTKYVIGAVWHGEHYGFHS